MQTFSYQSLEERARQKLSPTVFDYVASGSGDEVTLRKNVEAFHNVDILPRVLASIESRDHSIEILNQRLPVPFMLAPVGYQTVMHPEGELASARAAANFGTGFIASTVATHSLEKIKAELGSVPSYFQLYWPSDEDIAVSFVQRAEQAGYDAIFITVDTPLLGWRQKDLQNSFFPMESGAGMGNFVEDPVFREKFNVNEETPRETVGEHIKSILFNDRLTWESLAFLREHTKLPIFLKGVVHPVDARKAIDYGVDGIVVSNHGGRQLDGSIATLDALPQVAAEINGKIPILLDSGVRTGADIVKALALGASGVLIGRPFLYGLVDGAEGVERVLTNLQSDFDISLALSGISKVSELLWF